MIRILKCFKKIILKSLEHKNKQKKKIVFIFSLSNTLMK